MDSKQEIVLWAVRSGLLDDAVRDEEKLLREMGERSAQLLLVRASDPSHI